MKHRIITIFALGLVLANVAQAHGPFGNEDLGMDCEGNVGMIVDVGYNVYCCDGRGSIRIRSI